MKLEYPKEWFEQSADIEAGQTIGAGCPAAICSPVVDQALVDQIYARANETRFGIGTPKTELDLDAYGKPWTLETLALVLVNGFHDKYDLVSIMQAALEEISENTEIADR
jgi:hypothetical protein